MENINNFENIMNLKIITKLINLLGDTKDIKDFEEKGIVFNSKIYNISKNDNCITVKCSDGRSLELKIGVSSINYGYGEKQNNYFELKTNIPNGDIIRISETYRRENNELVNKFFDEEHFNYDKLIGDYKIDYIPKNEIYYYQLTWDSRYNRFTDGCGPIHTKDGYLYYDGIDKYLVSKDLDRIIYLNDKKLPSLENINKFNYDEEKEKFDNILKEYDFSEISKELLSELINNLETKKNLVKKINKAYKHTVIPICKQEIEKELEINDNINENVFSKEELVFILEVMNQININKEDYINILSREELEELYKTLNSKSKIKKLLI